MGMPIWLLLGKECHIKKTKLHFKARLQFNVGHCFGRGFAGLLSEPSQHAEEERGVSTTKMDGE